MQFCTVKGLDKKVARIALGTAWFAYDIKDVCFEVMDAYVAAGGNVIDTGRFYSGGVSENIITEWLPTQKRDELILVNKACHHFVDENNVHFPENNRVSAEYITEDLEYSLKNMKVDSFDIYVLHRDNTEVPVAGLMDRLEQHHLEGKIKAYGVSNWTISRIEEANAYCKKMGYQGITVNSPSYSLAAVNKPRWVGTEYVDSDYVKRCNADGVTVFAWGSQGAGFFVPLWKDSNAEAPQDVKDAFFTAENFERLHRAEKLAVKYKVEPINIALAYVLNPRFDVFASIGPRNVKELNSCFKALNFQMTTAELDYLELKREQI